MLRYVISQIPGKKAFTFPPAFFVYAFFVYAFFAYDFFAYIFLCTLDLPALSLSTLSLPSLPMPTLFCTHFVKIIASRFSSTVLRNSLCSPHRKILWPLLC
jgi:hypothetical protein